jgi:transposase
VFLLVVHHVPVECCAQVIEALSRTRPSDGFVHSMIARAAVAVCGVNMLIRALVITARVICADEIPIRVGPGPKASKKYLLVACTNLLTYFYLGERSMKSFDAFVFPDMPRAAIVHDRYRNYDNVPPCCTSCAPSTCCATWKTPHGPTWTRSGPARPPAPRP